MVDGVVASRQREDLLGGLKAWVRLYYSEFSDAALVEPEYLAAWQTITGGPGFHPMDRDVADVIADVQAAITDESGRVFDPVPELPLTRKDES